MKSTTSRRKSRKVASTRTNAASAPVKAVGSSVASATLMSATQSSKRSTSTSISSRTRSISSVATKKATSLATRRNFTNHLSSGNVMGPLVSHVRSLHDYPVGTPTPHNLRHMGPSDQDVTKMLKVVGYDSVEHLMKATVPKDIQSIDRLNLDPPVTEHEALEELSKMMSQNKVYTTHIGKGYYDTVTPKVILRNLIENPAWYTAYTPYQAEISQGRLEMLLNFQTMCADLTKLPVASASLLDEGTAAAEALMMLWGRSNQKTALVDKNTHIQTIDLLHTRARGYGMTIKLVDLKDMESHIDDDVFGVLVSYPGSDGNISDVPDVVKSIKKNSAGKVKVAVASDLMSLAVLTPPGEFGADACFGNSQRFGVPLGYGGPHAAFLTTTEDYKRKMPGRIIGVSRDSRGKPALRMAMQAREQHIRRERASSNICTAQALLANAAAAYAVYHGPTGIEYIAKSIHASAVTTARELERVGDGKIKINNKHFFDTISVTVADEALGDAILVALDKNEINVHAEPDGKTFHIAFDEPSANVKAVKKLVNSFAEGLSVSGRCEVDTLDLAASAIPDFIARTSDYLTHPVFNSHRSETAMLRYLYKLQTRDLSLTSAMIPLGSCTMKLNATSEMMPISWESVNRIHPFVPPSQTKGYQQLLAELGKWLCANTGFDAVSLQPNSGANGEYAGLNTILAYHRSRGEGHRNVCLIPASAHGTNPASAVLAGLSVVVVACDKNGNIDVDDLKAKAIKHKDNLAAIQVTYPSTHGVYETKIREICNIIHENGGQVYLDGANMNAQVGWTSPGDIGADVCHINLHKSHSIPHGGGGPGMGPIAVRAHLAKFLPRHSYVTEEAKVYGAGNKLNDDFVKGDNTSPETEGPKFIHPKYKPGVVIPAAGEITSAVSAAPFGSASILPIPYMYMKMLGAEGLKKATATAVLNANYLRVRLKDHYPVLFTGDNGTCAHEFIIDLRDIKKRTGISEEDVAKRLMDYGFHAPTMSFPVPGTLMIEPTESEPLYELDRFATAMISIKKEIDQVESGVFDKVNNPLKNAPHTADMCLSDQWDKPYPRELAAYPVASLYDYKFWPTVSRLDNVYGDRNVVCVCPPIEDYQDKM